jgi:hypothetical protein
VQIDSEKGLPWRAPENIEANHGIADANVFLWMLKISQIPAKSGHFKQIKLHITGERDSHRRYNLMFINNIE